jgi:hypothetical protein
MTLRYTLACLLIGLVSVSSFSEIMGQSILLEDPIVITSSNGPRDIVIDNLNADAILDFAVVQNSSDDVKVHIGQGGLAYNTPWSFGAADSPQRIASGDFNGDGFPDIAVTSSTGDIITVRLNNQNGAFNTSATYSAGNTPIGITTGYFNNDTFLDLACAIDLGDEKAIYLGNGDGTFQSALISFGGDRPQGIVTGDLNGDGLADLVVSNKNDAEIGVFLGNGDGTFGAISSYPSGGSGPEFLELGYMNSDTILDVVTSNGGPDLLGVLLGIGDGSFEAPNTYSAPLDPKGLAISDFNQDGFNDVAVACETADSLSISLGNGDGTLSPAINFLAGNGTYNVKNADMNNDGVDDIVVVNRLSGGSIYIYLNNPCFNIAVAGTNTTTVDGEDGTASVTITGGVPPFGVLWDDPLAQTTETATGLSPGIYSVTVSDGGTCELTESIEISNPICNVEVSTQIDNLPATGASDGALSVQIIGGNDPFTFAWDTPMADTSESVDGLPAGEYSVIVSDSIGCPTQASVYLMNAVAFCDTLELSTRIEEIYFADLNEDGVDDFIGLNPWSDVVVTYDGQENGEFVNQGVYGAGAYTQNAVIADFNGDDNLDIIATAPDSPNIGIVVLIGNGDGTFQDGVEIAVGSRPYDIEYDDLDGDGDLDLVVTRDQGDDMRVLSNDGLGSFFPGSSFDTGLAPKHMTKGDFNEDGLMDFVASNSSQWHLSVRLGNGSLIPSSGDEISCTYQPYDLISVDVNNDGHLDLATVHDGDDHLSVFLGNGDGTFQDGMLFETPVQPLAMSFGDYNGDGYVDLSTANRNGFSVSIFPGSGTGEFNIYQSWYFELPLEITTADIDGDGDDDLVFALNNISPPYKVTFLKNCLIQACPGDFNNDGEVNSEDLLTFLSQFGCMVDCIADMNDDGVTNSSDLLLFLAAFGGDC